MLGTGAKQVNENLQFMELMRETGKKAVMAVEGRRWG